jgi:hypothetical protein
VQGVNNVLICLIQVFKSLTTKLDRDIQMFASAETGSQLMTATPIITDRWIMLQFLPSADYKVVAEGLGDTFCPPSLLPSPRLY